MKKTILFSIITLNVLFCAQAEDFELWGKEISLDGEVRSRFAYFNNYDMDYSTSSADLASDMRGLLNLKISGSSPFYFNTLLELGNIDIDENLKAGDFIDFELREFYLGFKNSTFKIKAGNIDLNSPGSYVYEDDEWGLKLKCDFNFMEIKFFLPPQTLRLVIQKKRPKLHSLQLQWITFCSSACSRINMWI